MVQKRGMEKERQIVRKLREEGVTALRVCGSGGGTPVPRPDIVAYDTRCYYAIEVKSTSKDVVYIEKKQIRELVEFAKLFNAVPIVAIAFRNVPVNYVSPKELKCTKNGNFKFSRGMLSKINEILLSPPPKP